jgi:hypothetical protein
MITQPAVSTSPEGVEHTETSERRAIERAVMHKLQECGCNVSPEKVRHEVRRALGAFRDARIRQYISIFVVRDVCCVLLEHHDDA